VSNWSAVRSIYWNCNWWNGCCLSYCQGEHHPYMKSYYLLLGVVNGKYETLWNKHFSLWAWEIFTSSIVRPRLQSVLNAGSRCSGSRTFRCHLVKSKQTNWYFKTFLALQKLWVWNSFLKKIETVRRGRKEVPYCSILDRHQARSSHCPHITAKNVWETQIFVVLMTFEGPFATSSFEVSLQLAPQMWNLHCEQLGLMLETLA